MWVSSEDVVGILVGEPKFGAELGERDGDGVFEFACIGEWVYVEDALR